MTPEERDAMWSNIEPHLPAPQPWPRDGRLLHPIESTDLAFDVFGCPTYEELTRRRRLVNRARYTLFAVLLAALGGMAWGLYAS